MAGTRHDFETRDKAIAQRQLFAMPIELPGCEVERKVVEHLRIVGPMERSNEAFGVLCRNGYAITRSGPYTDRHMIPSVDITRFLLTGERCIRGYETCEECGGTGAACGEMAGMICGLCVGTGLQPQTECD